MKDFDKLNKAKQTYNQTAIPKELSSLVNQTIQSHNVKKPIAFTRWVVTAAAGILVVFTVALNTSMSFAMEMQDLPIIGTIAKVLTVRSYEVKNDDAKTDVKIPAIEVETQTPSSEEQNSETIQKITDINAEIEKYADQYVQEATQRVQEYKQAFIETGGTEAEFAEKDIEIKVDYEIKSQTPEYLSFVLFGTESWVSAYAQTYYYNIDLTTGDLLTLKDLLGENYIEIANSSITKQMVERLAADENLSYFDESMGGFETITDETRFYINENNNPVIVFDKYEIAPGAFGPQEFEITTP